MNPSWFVAMAVLTVGSPIAATRACASANVGNGPTCHETPPPERSSIGVDPRRPPKSLPDTVAPGETAPGETAPGTSAVGTPAIGASGTDTSAGAGAIRAAMARARSAYRVPG